MRYFWMVLEWIGAMTILSLGWLLEQIGQATIAAGQGIAQWARRTCFSNWRRTAVTLVCSAMIAVHYYPSQAGPIVAPLMTIAVVLFGIRVMFHPYFPIGGRPRRRRRN